MQEIYKNLKDDFLLIGLTGAIASGSTTVAFRPIIGIKEELKGANKC